MLFKELLDRKEKLEQLERANIKSAECERLATGFSVIMREKYSCQVMQSPVFLETEVPREIMNSFRALYQCYSDILHSTRGTRLEEIE